MRQIVNRPAKIFSFNIKAAQAHRKSRKRPQSATYFLPLPKKRTVCYVKTGYMAPKGNLSSLGIHPTLPLPSPILPPLPFHPQPSFLNIFPDKHTRISFPMGKNKKERIRYDNCSSPGHGKMYSHKGREKGRRGSNMKMGGR